MQGCHVTGGYLFLKVKNNEASRRNQGGSCAVIDRQGRWSWNGNIVDLSCVIETYEAI